MKTQILYKSLFVILFQFLPNNAYAECISGNCTNGHGTFIWVNGDKYVGEWKDNKFNWPGTYFNNGVAKKRICKDSILVK